MTQCLLLENVLLQRYCCRALVRRAPGHTGVRWRHRAEQSELDRFLEFHSVPVEFHGNGGLFLALFQVLVQSLTQNGVKPATPSLFTELICRNLPRSSSSSRQLHHFFMAVSAPHTRPVAVPPALAFSSGAAFFFYLLIQSKPWPSDLKKRLIDAFLLPWWRRWQRLELVQSVLTFTAFSSSSSSF